MNKRIGAIPLACLILMPWVSGVMAAEDAFQRGLAAKKAGRFDRAITLLATATAEHPENAEAWFHYGTVLGWEGRLDEALVALDKGLARAPHDFDLRMARARVLAWKSDYPTADRVLAELEKEFPRNLDVSVMRARVANWRGDIHEAKQRYESILQMDARQVDALTGLGDIKAEASKFSEARDLYERAYAQDASPDIRRRLEGLDQMTLWRVDGGVTGSTFERGDRDDWWSVYTLISHKWAGFNWWLRVEQGERFKLHDTTLELGVGGQVMKGVEATLLGGFTPDAGYSANWYGDGSIRWHTANRIGPLGRGWLLTEARWADYHVAGVFTSRIGWEQELGKGLHLNARWIHSYYDFGDGTDGWVAYLSQEPSDGWLWKVGVAQSVESLTNQAVAGGNLQSWTAFAAVVFPLSSQWSARVDIEREEVKNSVVRYGLGVGLGRKF